jgi:O-antigen/teichoic acid export membrane protein
VTKKILPRVNQIKFGAILTYSTIVLTTIIGILLTPFIIRMLGEAEYGLYILIGSMIGYLTVLDLGLNDTIIRFIAKYRAENNKNGEERFLATVMLVYLGISLLVVIIGAFIYINFNWVFRKSLSSEELIKAKIMFVILVFNVAMTLPGGAFTAICNGYERFVFPRLINIIRYIIRSAMVCGILWMGGKAISIVVIDTCMNIIIICISAYYSSNIIKAKVRLFNFDKSILNTIFKYSIWIFVFAIVGQFQWQTGGVILGMLTGTKLVAIYSIGVVLGSYYGAFSTAISSLFLPRATQMVTGDYSNEDLTSMMVKVGRVCLLILLFILGGFYLFGREFIHLWVGDNFRESWVLAMLIMIGYTTPLVQSFANSILEARALLAFKAILYLCMTIIGTTVGAFLVKDFGATGMMLGSTGAWMVSQIIMNFYFHRILKLNIFRFFKELLKSILIPFLIVMVFCTVATFHSTITWPFFILNSLIYTIVYAIMMFRFGMNDYEKNLVAIPLLDMRGKFNGILVKVFQ